MMVIVIKMVTSSYVQDVSVSEIALGVIPWMWWFLIRCNDSDKDGDVK